MKLLSATLLLLAQMACAGLTFDSTLVEVEAGAADTQVGAAFTFTNKSGETVHVSHVKPDCSCVSIEISQNGKLDYKPGESGTIRIVFDIGNSIGSVDQIVAVWLKGDPKDKPSIQLTARIKIPELVSVEPKTLKWTLHGDAGEQRIHVTMNHDQPITVTRVVCSKESFKVKLETIEAGKRYDIVVQPDDTAAQGMAVLSILTDCKVKKQQRQQAYAMILKEP